MDWMAQTIRTVWTIYATYAPLAMHRPRIIAAHTTINEGKKKQFELIVSMNVPLSSKSFINHSVCRSKCGEVVVNSANCSTSLAGCIYATGVGVRKCNSIKVNGIGEDCHLNYKSTISMEWMARTIRTDWTIYAIFVPIAIHRRRLFAASNRQ